MIIWQEKLIFVGFKEIISWQRQESIQAVKKSFFQTSSRLLFWRVRIFSTHFLWMLCLWKTILRIQGISEYKLEHHTTSRNDYTTGESYFCQNFENGACLCVEYSMRIVKIWPVKPLRGSKKIFPDVK